MSMNSEVLTITLDRRLLEHPQGLHLRRMRSSIWLYLAILARLPKDQDTVEIETPAVANSMGLPEGTIRSWLGHLRKHRYVEVRRVNGGYSVRVKHIAAWATTPDVPKPTPFVPRQRFFTVAKLAKALGEKNDRTALEVVLDQHSDDAIRTVLAKTLAVPAERIRRSRTALFLYILKNDHAPKN
jgi:hypothetical protein